MLLFKLGYEYRLKMLFFLCDSMLILCRHNVYDEVLYIKWQVNGHMFTRISFRVLEYYYLMELLSILCCDIRLFPSSVQLVSTVLFMYIH